MLTVASPADALAAIQEHFGAIRTRVVSVPLAESLGRVLAEDIRSREDVPGFDRSTMDGYAVHAQDTFGATEALPAMLKPVGTVHMGQVPAFSLNKGECAYIPTGGELPQGADGVVMVEYTENLNDGFLYVQSSIAPGANVIYRGDDVKEGQLLMKQGQVIRPQEVGALAALGVPLAPVYERLRVGILSTGDELVEVSAPQTGSVVRDVNTYVLSAGLSAIGAEPVRYGITKDDHASLTAALSIALRECDAVLISGGSSVGTADMTRRIIDEAGRPGVFLHGVAVKPGKPTIVGDIGGKPVFGLPGHPVSAYFIFRIFAAPILQRMMGVIREQPREAFAIMGRNVPSNHGRQEYLPVALTEEDGRKVALPVASKSGLITTLVGADGFVCIPRDAEGLMRGQHVTVTLF